LDLYNRLLPERQQLQAALLIEVADEARLTEELASWQELRDEELCLCLGDARLPSVLVTCRPEDRTLGAAHWVQFSVNDEARRLLADFRRPARFTVCRPNYQHDSPPLSEEVRQSLLDDLQLSDRDCRPPLFRQPLGPGCPATPR
jgi:hypothetical protein